MPRGISGLLFTFHMIDLENSSREETLDRLKLAVNPLSAKEHKCITLITTLYSNTQLNPIAMDFMFAHNPINKSQVAH
ncbi:hypothetical protein FRX31_023031 [Thalictrum thalictroides]|uniref:Uncharacterized protein n=1 Tax=Thalictrum thalictroides TaxID=46969 RepID=A0A7J6VR90_THATH|nr:hypothetical protein FRX31_023031 [Thalictrum thalictroides]